jgi:acyl carrier protein
MSSELTERIVGLIAKTQHLEPGKVTPESTFSELGIDSLDGINIAFALESEFGVDIPDEALPEMRSVKDIVSGIERLLAQKNVT